MSTTPLLADTLVVGAGWSGLIASLKLAQAGKRVVLLEARKRIGGRAFTHSWNDATPLEDSSRNATNEPVHAVDFGCSWIHGYNEGNPVKELAQRYGVKVHVPKSTPSQIIGPHGPLAADLAAKLQANLSAAQSAATSQARTSAGRLSKGDGQATDPSLASFLLAPASPLFTGLETSEEKHLAIALARSLHIPLGTSLEQIALTWTGFEDNFAGTDGAPEGGFSRLINLVAKELTSLGVEIRTGHVVEQITDSLAQQQQQQQQQQCVEVSAKDEEGKGKDVVYTAKSAIVTIPLAVLKETHGNLFKPKLPARKQDIIDRVNVGNLNKVLLTYETPWWPLETGTFFVLPTSSSSPSASPSLADTFRETTLIVSSLCAPHGLPGSTNSLLVMVGAQAAKDIEQYTRLEVAEALHDYLYARLKNPSGTTQPKLRHTFYSRWGQQPFTRGATTTPVVIGDPSNSPLDFEELSRPVWDGRLSFAGEACDLNHRGSVAGAVLSGERAAKSILKVLSKL